MGKIIKFPKKSKREAIINKINLDVHEKTREQNLFFQNVEEVVNSSSLEEVIYIFQRTAQALFEHYFIDLQNHNHPEETAAKHSKEIVFSIIQKQFSEIK